ENSWLISPCAHTEPFNGSLYVSAGCPQGCQKVARGMRHILCCGHTNQIAWQCWGVCAVVQHEGAVSAQPSNEQTKFKEHIVARHRALDISRDGEIISREHQHGEIELLDR